MSDTNGRNEIFRPGAEQKQGQLVLECEPWKSLSSTRLVTPQYLKFHLRIVHISLAWALLAVGPSRSSFDHKLLSQFQPQQKPLQTHSFCYIKLSDNLRHAYRYRSHGCPQRNGSRQAGGG